MAWRAGRFSLTLLTQIFGFVTPGRYRLGANFIGGIEGGPTQFDLRAASRSAAGGAGQGGEPG